MFRVRRVDSEVPFVRRLERRVGGLRRYEIEIVRRSPSPGSLEYHAAVRRGAAVRRLERTAGTGDAWAYLHAADRARVAGDRSWVVEYGSGLLAGAEPEGDLRVGEVLDVVVSEPWESAGPPGRSSARCSVRAVGARDGHATALVTFDEPFSKDGMEYRLFVLEQPGDRFGRGEDASLYGVPPTVKRSSADLLGADWWRGGLAMRCTVTGSAPIPDD